MEGTDKDGKRSDLSNRGISISPHFLLPINSIFLARLRAGIFFSSESFWEPCDSSELC